MDQYNMFGQLESDSSRRLAKGKFSYSIYAVPKYHDCGHIETVVQAYSEKQARYLFYKNHLDYRIVEVYRI